MNKFKKVLNFHFFAGTLLLVLSCTEAEPKKGENNMTHKKEFFTFHIGKTQF